MFIQFVLTKNKNLYSLYNVSKYKIYKVLREKAKTCSCKNKFTIEETNNKQNAYSMWLWMFITH